MGLKKLLEFVEDFLIIIFAFVLAILLLLSFIYGLLWIGGL
jgi:hypothetical protein